MEWRDATSYDNYGHRGKVAPSTWSTFAGHYRIVLTRRVGLDGWWWISDQMDNRVYRPIDAEDIEAAKLETIEKAKSYLMSIRESVDEALAELNNEEEK